MPKTSDIPSAGDDMTIANPPACFKTRPPARGSVRYLITVPSDAGDRPGSGMEVGGGVGLASSFPAFAVVSMRRNVMLSAYLELKLLGSAKGDEISSSGRSGRRIFYRFGPCLGLADRRQNLHTSILEHRSKAPPCLVKPHETSFPDQHR